MPLSEHEAQRRILLAVKDLPGKLDAIAAGVGASTSTATYKDSNSSNTPAGGLAVKILDADPEREEILLTNASTTSFLGVAFCVSFDAGPAAITTSKISIYIPPRNSVVIDTKGLVDKTIYVKSMDNDSVTYVLHVKDNQAPP